MTGAESIQDRADELKRKFYRSGPTFRAVQSINRWKKRRYDHEFLKRWEKEYLG